MEAIKGSDVNVPDAVFAWMLDGRGGVKPLENTDVIDEAHPCWLHLNYVHHDSAQWLARYSMTTNTMLFSNATCMSHSPLVPLRFVSVRLRSVPVHPYSALQPVVPEPTTGLA